MGFDIVVGSRIADKWSVSPAGRIEGKFLAYQRVKGVEKDLKGDRSPGAEGQYPLPQDTRPRSVRRAGHKRSS